jgi:transcriptional regulator with XRE-family HTH domain
MKQMKKYRLQKSEPWPRGSQSKIANILGMSQQNLAHYLAGRTVANKETAERIISAAKKCGARITRYPASKDIASEISATTAHRKALERCRARNAAKYRWEISKGLGWMVGDGVRLANALHWGKARVYSYVKNGSRATNEVKDLIVNAARDCGVDVVAELNEKQQEQK